jgi:hypothetical protein
MCAEAPNRKEASMASFEDNPNYSNELPPEGGKLPSSEGARQALRSGVGGEDIGGGGGLPDMTLASRESCACSDEGPAAEGLPTVATVADGNPFADIWAAAASVPARPKRHQQRRPRRSPQPEAAIIRLPSLFVVLAD